MRWSVSLTSDDPDEQVFDALRMMAKYVREDYRHPLVAYHAAVATAGARDPVEQIARIFWYVRNRVAFMEDQSIAAGLASLYREPVVEVFIRPVDMAIYLSSGTTPVGDCDDFSMWVAALLAARGIPSRFAVVAADPDFPRLWSHVYVVAYPGWDPGMRMPVDASHGPYPGWEYPARTRLMEYPIFEDHWKGVAIGFGLMVLAAVLPSGGSDARRSG